MSQIVQDITAPSTVESGSTNTNAMRGHGVVSNLNCTLFNDNIATAIHNQVTKSLDPIVVAMTHSVEQADLPGATAAITASDSMGHETALSPCLSVSSSVAVTVSGMAGSAPLALIDASSQSSKYDDLFDDCGPRAKLQGDQSESVGDDVERIARTAGEHSCHWLHVDG